MRLDLYLFQNLYTRSRQRAKELIEDNKVKIDGHLISKPSWDIDEHSSHSVTIDDDCPYVSRGGLKLQAILEGANIVVNNKICLDIGASTGGFTHCLLLNGASKVYAVDSGTNQLDSSLNNDFRVVSIEGYNARSISLNDIGEMVDIITIDVSFISQTLIMPNALAILNSNGNYLSLIKPQFEAGKNNIGKGGIVKDKKARLLAVEKVIDCARALSYKCNYFAKSPILGGDGNIEYIASFSKNGDEINSEYIKKIVLNT